MNSNIQIEHFSKSDWYEISTIYQEGIATGIATFETKVPSWETWDTTHTVSCRLKAIVNQEIAGWAASIYITTKFRNLGIGTLLLSALIKESESAGFWTLQAGIFSQNKASIVLHKSLGFREIGFREKIGKLNNIWYDNTILERRSKKIT